MMSTHVLQVADIYGVGLGCGVALANHETCTGGEDDGG